MSYGLRKSSFFVFIVATIIILLLIFFAIQGWLSPLKNILWQIFKPLAKAFFWLEQKIFKAINVFTALKDLIKENNNLRQENLSLWQQVASLKEAERENKLLRQRLLFENDGKKTLMVKVIGASQQAGQYLLVDKGFINGLNKGDWVVSADNFLIGYLDEVEEQVSKVILLSNSDSAINAVTQDSRASGIIKGRHGLGLALEMIPINKELQLGETVLALGKEASGGKNLAVGKVKEIIEKENELFKSALIEPAIDWSALEEVFILK